MSNKSNTAQIILLHGWSGSKKSLQPLSQQLENEGFKTLTLEMPGHGETKVMENPWNMNDFSKWLKSILTKSNINDYILVGHSFGGKIILNSLINNDLNPKKIVLIDSNGIRPRNSIKKALWKNLSKYYKTFESVMPVSVNDGLKNIIYRGIINERDYLNSKGNLKESFKLFNEEHFDKKISKINTPTLIIWGKDDTVTPLWMGQLLNALIKNSELKILDGSHSLPLKNPEKVAKLIKDFIENK